MIQRLLEVVDVESFGQAKPQVIILRSLKSFTIGTHYSQVVFAQHHRTMHWCRSERTQPISDGIGPVHRWKAPYRFAPLIDNDCGRAHRSKIFI